MLRREGSHRARRRGRHRAAREQPKTRSGARRRRRGCAFSGDARVRSHAARGGPRRIRGGGEVVRG